jgi:hypothetical protein
MMVSPKNVNHVPLNVPPVKTLKIVNPVSPKKVDLKTPQDVHVLMDITKTKKTPHVSNVLITVPPVKDPLLTVYLVNL